MTGERLLLKAIRGEAVERRPLWIMRQAGRYLPEYRELRRSYPFKAVAQSPELAARVTLMPMDRFPLDAAIVFADIMSPLPALGVDFDFDPGPVVEEPIRDRAGVDALTPPDPARLGPEVLAALRQTRDALPAETALLGFCGAPWTLAAYLVEGRGRKDFPKLRAFAAAEPKLLEVLLRKLSEAMATYLVSQARAGADAVQVFDSWAGLLSLADWERLIRPHLEMLPADGRRGRRAENPVPSERAPSAGRLRRPAGRGVGGRLAGGHRRGAATLSFASRAGQYRSGRPSWRRNPHPCRGRHLACSASGPRATS